MKARDLLVVGLCALSTVAICEVLFPASWANANPDEYQVTASATPVLELQDAELSLKTDKPVYRPGDKPVVTLKAVNHSDQPVSVKVKTRLFAMAPSSPMSRMVTMPRELWKQDCLVALKANETRTFTLETGAQIPKGVTGYFTIESGQKNVTVAHFSAPLPGVQGAEDEGLANQLGRGPGSGAGRIAGDRS